MELSIVESRETVDLGPRGELIRLIHIEYMLDHYGPFVYEVPKAMWNVEEFRKEVQQRAEELKELQGAQF